MLLKSFFAVTGLAHSALSLASYEPISNGPSYSVGIPSSSGISSSSTGPLYFSLSAPSTYQWVGLGIGGQMAGATIFVMYPDGKGNVTISSRDGGRGHVQPTFDSTIFAGVELLAGSGISGGVMTANVRCTTCTLDSSASSSSSPWIAAWMNSNSPTSSSSETFNIQQHDTNSYRQFTFDLSAAAISSDTNPFVSASTAGSASSGTSAGSSPSPSAASGSGNDNGSSGGRAGSGSSSASTIKSKLPTYEKAHGIIMASTVVLLFPIGAIIMRLAGAVWLHAAIQLFGLAALISGFGIGVYLAQQRNYLYKNGGMAHTIFGTIIIGLFLFQPFLGLLHHTNYKRTQERGIFSFMHIWYGRLLMAGGIVNGGLGIRLAGNVSNTYKYAYIAVAAVMAALYTVAVVVRRKGGRNGGGRRGKRERDASL